MSPERYYLDHGRLSDPRDYAARLAELPLDVAALCGVVQGLLIHDHYGGELYGEPPPGFATASRETLPVPQRLAAILSAKPAPLAELRPPQDRSVGTCRDFALLLCAALRQKGIAARVRCGFASYFTRPGYEDHWLCEYWVPGEGRGGSWHRADPQLDEAHCKHLAIDFDPSDVPANCFMPAWEAWQIARRSEAEARRFGHGPYRGAWLVQVNLARDLLALHKREVSPWDDWRAAGEQGYALDGEALERSERLADLASAAQDLQAPPALGDEFEAFLATPPWERLGV